MVTLPANSAHFDFQLEQDGGPSSFKAPGKHSVRLKFFKSGYMKLRESQGLIESVLGPSSTSIKSATIQFFGILKGSGTERVLPPARRYERCQPEEWDWNEVEFGPPQWLYPQ
jgi:hypothetical protein